MAVQGGAEGFSKMIYPQDVAEAALMVVRTSFNCCPTQIWLQVRRQTWGHTSSPPPPRVLFPWKACSLCMAPCAGRAISESAHSVAHVGRAWRAALGECTEAVYPRLLSWCVRVDACLGVGSRCVTALTPLVSCPQNVPDIVEH